MVIERGREKPEGFHSFINTESMLCPKLEAEDRWSGKQNRALSLLKSKARR
jgi:hypothetical protein